MALLLCIDTAMDNAAVCISNGTNILSGAQSSEQKNHASFVQPAIEYITKQSNIRLEDIDAVAVVNGPGSYTGLRVGLATAKGLCYTLGKPLINVGTLEMLAHASVAAFKGKGEPVEDLFFCPMIDARRMEVFTSVFDYQLNTVVGPSAVILTETHYFESVYALGKKIIFSGSGHEKFKSINTYSLSDYYKATHSIVDMAFIAEKNFNKKNYDDIVFSEPNYLKDFYMKQL